MKYIRKCFDQLLYMFKAKRMLLNGMCIIGGCMCSIKYKKKKKRKKMGLKIALPERKLNVLFNQFK